MVFKNIPITIFLNQILIVMTAAPLIYLITGPRYYFAIYLIPVLIFEIYILFLVISRSTRSINYFFEAVRNNDSGLSFPTEVKNKELSKIHENLNKVNQIIQDIKTKNIAREKFYLNLIQHSATGLIAVNPAGSVILMNHKGYEYSGLAPNLSPEHIKTQNDGFYSILERIRAGETVLNKSVRNGKIIYLSIHSSELKLEEGIYKLISLQDIRHELDHKELDSWIKLIRILTHEILNSIAPITSLTQTIRSYFDNEKTAHKPVQITEQLIHNTVEALGVIEERGKGLLEFVNKFRTLSRIPEPVIRQVSLISWLNHIRTLLYQDVTNNNITFEIMTDKRISHIDIDERLLTQVVINIINNAADALQERESNRKITFEVQTDISNRVMIRISNNGPAITEDIADKIFMPFYTTKKNGSGIGLSLSRQIIRMHGGHLYLESSPGLTSFMILL